MIVNWKFLREKYALFVVLLLYQIIIKISAQPYSLDTTSELSSKSDESTTPVEAETTSLDTTISESETTETTDRTITIGAASSLIYSPTSPSVSSFLSSEHFTSSSSVEKLFCASTSLLIPYYSPIVLSPFFVLRSETFSLPVTFVHFCRLPFTFTFSWNIFYFNDSLGSASSILNSSQITTLFTSELNIPPYTIDYGVYNISFSFSLMANNSAYLSEVFTFVKIIPSGIVVNPFYNGVLSFSVGLDQSFYLAPYLYSTDLDFLISPDLLNFTFYCSSSFYNVSLAANTLLDNLLEIQKQGPSTLNSSCFSSTSKKISIVSYFYISQKVILFF
jgi:hypothetical protein